MNPMGYDPFNLLNLTITRVLYNTSWSPWSSPHRCWISMILGTCRDEDCGQDKRYFTKQFYFTHTTRYVKGFHWPLHRIPGVERLMPHPIPYQTTHTWRSDREKKSFKKRSWDWLVAICLTMDAFYDAWLQVWTRWESTMVVEMAMEKGMLAARVCGWRRWWRGSGIHARCYVDISMGSL